MIRLRRMGGVTLPSEGPTGVFTQPSGPVITYFLPQEEIERRYGRPTGSPRKREDRAMGTKTVTDAAPTAATSSSPAPYFYIGQGSRVRIAEMVKRAPALLELLGDDATIDFVDGAILVKGS